ncbi:MAG: alcohol dehydrogenase catalytic domain-containing protein [Acidobacteriota bacterium]|nr:alcohol dehydrogenase catalytic domain-containing protein [Acidobacteriota bacterium]
MRALVCDGPEQALLREVRAPEPGPGEVLVRVTSALTCATDFKLLKRGHPKIPFPLTLGHEFAGVVERTGEGAGFQPGERVTSSVSAPCGGCEACRVGRENLCVTAFERPLFGAFADFLLVPERIVKNGLRRIPPGLSDEAAALLDPLASVVHGLGRAGTAADGGDVLIVGTGPIAAMLFFLLRGKEGTDASARRIVVAGRREARLEFFLERGAEVSRIEASPRATGSLVIDTTGDAGVISALPDLAADGGTVLLFAGLPAGARVSLDAHALHYREVSIVGSFHYTPRDADEALALLSRGAVPAADIVSARCPLDDWRAAFDLAQGGAAMKVSLVP